MVNAQGYVPLYFTPFALSNDGGCGCECFICKRFCCELFSGECFCGESFFERLAGADAAENYINLCM